MNDTSLRRIETLRLIPRAPHWITTADLVERLNNIEHCISQRTVQRDLISLSTIFPLDYEVNGRTHCWRWSNSAEVLDLPGMNPQTALSFFLAEQYLYEMLPPSAVDSLEPHFNKAREVLHEIKSKKMDSWIDKIRVMPEAQRLLAPVMNSEVVGNIYTSLLESEPFSADYRKKGDKNPTQYEVINPLGLVFRSRVAYLVASLYEYDNPVQLALHRFSSFTALKSKSIYVPKDFNLDRYIESGGFDYCVGDDFVVELVFSKKVITHLEESSLSRDQHLSNIEDGRALLKATVQNTSRLRWWLKGFGSEVEIVAPASLRKEFGDEARALSVLYKEC